jgi:hypothetical protein
MHFCHRGHLPCGDRFSASSEVGEAAIANDGQALTREYAGCVASKLQGHPQMKQPFVAR